MDREILFKQAKKLMLKDKEHGPIVFAETKDQNYCLPVIGTDLWNTDAFGRMKTLFILGRTFAQEECINAEMILSLCFIQEFWFVHRSPDDPEVEAPSKEQDRREGLGLLELRIQGRQIEQSFWMSEIIRHGNIIDLAPSHEAEQPQSRLLLSFLAGVSSAQYNDQEFDEVVKRFAEVGEI